MNTALGLALAVGFILWVCVRVIRKRDVTIAHLRDRLEEAQQIALRLQLNPHLLLNTLNAISAFVAVDTVAARRMICDLGELMRASLENDSGGQVPLSRELHFLRRYIEIERMRFGDRLQVEIEPDPDTLEAAVPDLILQPLVENAIRHAVEHRVSGGRIALRTRRHGQSLILQITDNGRDPHDPARATPEARPRRTCEGIGLRNTRRRLVGLYGASHRLELVPNEAGGLTASVVIPYQLAAA